MSPIPSVQVFASIFPEMIFVDLTGAATTIGSGLRMTTLSTDDTSEGGTLTPATLDGTVTYTFTPCPDGPRTVDLGDDADRLRRPRLCRLAAEKRR